jgi:hypothetical protein
VPATIRVGVPSRGADNLVDEVEARAIKVLVDFGRDLGLGNAGFGPLLHRAPHRRVTVSRRDLEALNLVLGLYDARSRHNRPSIDQVHTLLLEGLVGLKVQGIHANSSVRDPVLLQYVDDGVGHPLCHHLFRPLSPFPRDGRSYVVEPGSIDLGTDLVGADRLEKNRLAPPRQHRIPDKDIVLPVALEYAGHVADVLAHEQDEGIYVVLFHLVECSLEAFAAHAAEVDPSLPICIRSREDAPRRILVFRI